MAPDRCVLPDRWPRFAPSGLNHPNGGGRLGHLDRRGADLRSRRMGTELVGVERAEQVTGQDPHAAPRPGLPIRVAAVNDYGVVVAGLAAMLSRFPGRLHVC